jgi:MSHA biogenesis protein MshJ
LYEHDVKLVLQGGYFDTLAYISALEERAATLTLSLLDYRVETYPRAEITLQVSTLSLDPEWLAL